MSVIRLADGATLFGGLGTGNRQNRRCRDDGLVYLNRPKWKTVDPNVAWEGQQRDLTAGTDTFQLGLPAMRLQDKNIPVTERRTNENRKSRRSRRFTSPHGVLEQYLVATGRRLNQSIAMPQKTGYHAE